MLEVVFLPQSPPAPRRRVSSTLDRLLIASNIELPLYVREGVDAYMGMRGSFYSRSLSVHGCRNSYVSP